MPTNVADYTVGWICAIDTEYVVACELLDEEYKKDDEIPRVNDHNIYTFGRIHQHYVVIACLPNGRYGLTSAAIVAERMRFSFPALRFGLMVGIAGGAPSDKHDIRLGDIVVSSPTPKHGGVIQYDFGKAIQDHEFEETGHLAPPPEILLNALSKIRAQHKRWGHKIPETIEEWLKKNKRLKADYDKPDTKLDRLYKSSYTHPQEEICDCQINNRDSNGEELRTITNDREERDSEDGLQIHYGLVASANTLMKDARARDAIAQKYNVLCFEMEAAGLMNSFPCMVIRGICDYSDTHKNNRWQGYAAAIAAAYAKELLEIIPATQIQSHSIPEAIHKADAAIREYYRSTDRLQIQRLSGETLPLEKCYINLALKDLSNEKQQSKDNSSFSLETRLKLEASDIGEQVTLDELFKTRKLSNGNIIEPRRIFIQGRAGVGKTTLCKKIAHEFLQCKLGDKLFDRLIWLPVRNLRERDTEYGWLELLQDVFCLSSQVPDWDDLAMAMSKQFSRLEFRHKTLFLLDGLDEASYEWKENSKIFKFLQIIISTIPNIILTSRPQASSLKIGKFDLEFEAIGFNRDQIHTYIDHCVTDNQTNSSMKDMIAAKPLLQSLLRIPVQLDAFCCTWSLDTMHEQSQSNSAVRQSLQMDRAASLTTMTTLYQEITNELCRKDLVRTGRREKSQTFHIFDVLQFMRKELRFLEELAFQGLVNDIIIFKHKHRELIGLHFKASGVEMPDNYILEQLSFLRTSSDQLHRSRRDFHFLHLTYQEFFAAKHFVRHWETDLDLYSLNLLSSPLSKAKVSPAKFLQKEKYNPRYSIFWRFVTGLIQLEIDKQSQGHELCLNDTNRRDVVTFFKQLNGEPVDLLHTTHRRLMMYCLSEVASSDAQAIQSLRKEEEGLLREWIIEEYYRTERIRLGKEVEFPEDILLSILQSKQSVLHKQVLFTLMERRTVNRRTLNVLADLMKNTLSGMTRPIAADVILQNSETSSQEIRSAAFTTLIKVLKDEDDETKSWAATAFARQSSLSPEVVATLVDLLRDEHVERHAARALRLQSSLPQEAIALLIGLLKSEDQYMKDYAEEALCRQSSLPQETIAALIALLKDERSQHSASRVLRGQRFLPQESINTLLALLMIEEQNVISCAVSGLGGQSTIPQDAVTILTTLLLKHESSNVRASTAEALGNLVPNIPQEGITTLITALLKDEQPSVRCSAARSLLYQMSLPQEAVDALNIVLVSDKDPDVRFEVATILSRQSSPLSQEAIAVIIALFSYRKRQFDAIVLLENQPSLPEEAVTALINILLKDENDDMRYAAASVLGRQPSPLPQKVITACTTTLFKNKSPLVIIYVAEILAKESSLPQEAIPTLINMPRDLFDVTYKILDRCNIYSSIEHFDNKTWQRLWSYWLSETERYEFCCYELEDALYLWVDGVLHRICADPKRTEELLQVALGTKHQQPKVELLETSNQKLPDQNSTQEASDKQPASASRSNSKSKPSWRSKLSSKLRSKTTLTS